MRVWLDSNGVRVRLSGAPGGNINYYLKLFCGDKLRPSPREISLSEVLERRWVLCIVTSLLRAKRSNKIGGFSARAYGKNISSISVSFTESKRGYGNEFTRGVD